MNILQPHEPYEPYGYLSISIINDIDFSCVSLSVIRWNKQYNDVDQYFFSTLLFNKYLSSNNVNMLSIVKQLCDLIQNDKINCFVDYQQNSTIVSDSIMGVNFVLMSLSQQQANILFNLIKQLKLNIPKLNEPIVEFDVQFRFQVSVLKYQIAIQKNNN